MTERKTVRVEFIIMAVILLAVAGIYGRVSGYGFIGLDDPLYIQQNPHVQQGFHQSAILWSLTDVNTGLWHPLTWWSHMLDWQLFNGNAGGHHLVNLIFHAINACLLFWILKTATSKMWESAFVALLFAVHPLNVESVAWVSERKNLLSTFFWFVSIAVYMWYARKPGAWRYLAVLGVFIPGLMAKPMLVTLPVILFLMDFWPLNRFRHGSPSSTGSPGESAGFSKYFPSRLLAEKLPMLILAFLSSCITIYAAREGEALRSIGNFPLSGRLCNVLLSYTAYMGKMIWPVNLSIFYPYRDSFNGMAVASSLAVLAAMTAVAWIMRRRQPYLLIGWLWFLITLIPVIGIVQVGYQSMADRYAYLPLIGLFLMVAWGTSDIYSHVHLYGAMPPIAAVMLITALAALSYHQLQYWQSGEKVFSHALAVTKNNHIAHIGLGYEYLKKNDLSAAEFQFRQALIIKPDDATALNDLSVIALRRGK